MKPGFSKEEILGAALGHSPVLFGIALLTAGITAFYMSRLFFMTFTGEYRGTLEKTHDLMPFTHSCMLIEWLIATTPCLAAA